MFESIFVENDDIEKRNKSNRRSRAHSCVVAMDPSQKSMDGCSKQLQ